MSPVPVNSDLASRVDRELARMAAPAALREQFHAAPAEWLAQFADGVDQSPYSLIEWLDALVRFSVWEEKHKRPLLLERKQEYLLCCIEGTGTRAPRIGLADALEHYLNTNGVRED